MLIRKGDMVRVVTGDDKGTTGRVLRVMRDGLRCR
jgi:ribosomal protein L24